LWNIIFEIYVNQVHIFRGRGRKRGNHFSNICFFEANALRVVLDISKRSIEAKGEKFRFSTLLNEFQESKDPSIMTIMVEDSAALLGIAIAGIGIFLSNQTGNTIYDSTSSLSIGLF
jgi:hypothetical protein